MIERFNQIHLFFKLQFTVILLGFIPFVYLSFNKGGVVLWVNDYHQPFLDIFFKYATMLAEDMVVVLVGIIMLAWQLRKAVIYGISFMIMTIFVVLGKLVIFKDWPRPAKVFQYDESVLLNFVEGVEISTVNSFPSGHTSAAFTIYGAIAVLLFRKSRLLALICFFMAVTIGFSRIYLNQHFYMDVYMGSVIGTFAAFIAAQLDQSKLFNKEWLQFSIFNRIGITSNNS